MLRLATRIVYSLLTVLTVVTILTSDIYNAGSFMGSRELSTTSHSTGYLRYGVRNNVTRLRSSNSSVVNNSNGVNLSLTMSDKCGNGGVHSLPQSVITGVKTLVFFIGIGRSGHSIIASILDSHPNMVVSNELNLFDLLNKTSCAVDRSFVFNKIWERSYTQATTSLRDTSKGYTLAVDGLYQGSYRSHIDVIGDKMGGSTINFFITNPAQFQNHLNNLHTVLNIPIKVLHVVRNPFDNIATKCLHIALKHQYSKFAAVKKDNLTVTVDHKLIDKQIAQYFQFYEASQIVKHKYQLDMMELHSKDLIASPKSLIIDMCDFLGVECSDDYLNVVIDKVFTAESKTRYNIQWTSEQIMMVKENIQKYEGLQPYLHFNW